MSLAWVGEVGRMPVALGMGMSVCTGMHVGISRVPVWTSMHGGRMVVNSGALMNLTVSLSCGDVHRVPGGLRGPGWGFVLRSFPGEGLELSKGDDRRKRRWMMGLRNGNWGLWSRVKQGALGLLVAILEDLGSLCVYLKCSLGEVMGIRVGRRVWDWSCASLARLIGTLYARLCLCAQALWCCLSLCCFVLLGHVRLWEVIRISQCSCIWTLW